MDQWWLNLLSHERGISHRCGQVSILSHYLAFIFQFLSQTSFMHSLSLLLHTRHPIGMIPGAYLLSLLRGTGQTNQENWPSIGTIVSTLARYSAIYGNTLGQFYWFVGRGGGYFLFSMHVWKILSLLLSLSYSLLPHFPLIDAFFLHLCLSILRRTLLSIRHSQPVSTHFSLFHT